jgi:hypothetical protein
MERLLNKLPFTTGIVVYFFLCGGLYLIGFWTTFEIDVTNFISITDIPKAFVLPLVVGAGFSLLNIFLNSVISRYSRDREQDPVVEERPKSIGRYLLRRLISLDFFIVITIAVALLVVTTNNLVAGYWLFFGFLIAILLQFKFIDSSAVKAVLKSSDLRLIVSQVLIFIPIACFVIGKGLSLKVLNNEKPFIYKETRVGTACTSNEKLKLVGFLGDKIVLSSMDNKKIIFVSHTSKEEFIILKE